MAIPHFSVKSGSRAKGSSAADRYRYICREGKYQQRQDLVRVTHHNYPAWASDRPEHFFEAADKFSRVNARLYTELEIALPRELTKDQQLRLIKDYVEKQIGKNHPYSVAFHCPKAMDGGLNPHVHVLMSERTVTDGIARNEQTFFKRYNSKFLEKGGAAVSKDWNRRDKVVELRTAWEKAVNLHLKRCGHDAVISLKSLQSQNIDRIPEPKLGARQTALLKQGGSNDNIALVKSLREIRRIEGNLGGIEKEITSTIKYLACEVVLGQQSFELVSAKEVKRSVTEQKMNIYAELRQVEQARFSLGLVRLPSGEEFYPSTNVNHLIKRRGDTEKEYQKLVEELAAAKRYEKELAILGQQQVKVVSGKPMADVDSLCDRPGFLQEVSEARTRILAKDKSTYHLELHLKPSQSPEPP